MSANLSRLKYAYLHGFGGSPLSTKGVQLQRWFAKELKTDLDRPDLNLPNFREQCLSHMLRFLEEKLRTADSKWLLIGSSFGGLLSTLLTQRQPDAIHSLILLAPAFNPVERWRTKFDIHQWKIDGFLSHFNPSTQRDEPLNYRFYEDLQNYPPYPIVTTCPITIIHGLEDDVVPIETSREYFRQLQANNSHPLGFFEVRDDHHLRTKKTLNLIQKSILSHVK